MLTYKELKNKPRELLTATGLKQDEFEGVLKVFAECYQERYAGQQTVSGQARQRRQGGGNQGKLRQMEDKLLFILEYQKNYPLQTIRGLEFGISQGPVNQGIHRLTPPWQHALNKLGTTPNLNANPVQNR